MNVRKNQANLSDAERTAYVSAVKALKTTASRLTPPTPSRYDDYIFVHMQAMMLMSLKDRTKPIINANLNMLGNRTVPWAHRAPAFLPWHRELLHQLELDLQAVSGNPKMTIPYWDWSVDQSKTGPPWTSDFMGGDGGGGPVTTGPFAFDPITHNWELKISEDGSDRLVRGFGLSPGFGTLPSSGDVSAVKLVTPYDASPWNDSGTLQTFRNQLEGWYVPPTSLTPVGLHNLVHVWVGGNTGTMLFSTSPNDPVFFVHHCNVDRIWAEWQGQNPGFGYVPTTPLPGIPGHGLNEPMIFNDPALSSTPPWSAPPATPASVLDHRALGYVYDTQDPCLPLIEEVGLLEDEIASIVDGLDSGEIPSPPRTPEKIARVRAYLRRLETRLASARRQLQACRRAHPEFGDLPLPLSRLSDFGARILQMETSGIAEPSGISTPGDHFTKRRNLPGPPAAGHFTERTNS
jgi:tyrosinase